MAYNHFWYVIIMRTYSIVAPFEDLNLPMYGLWSVHANSLQIVNDISSKQQAEMVLTLLLEMDDKGIVSDVLRAGGFQIKQSPFSAKQIIYAHKCFKESLSQN